MSAEPAQPQEEKPQLIEAKSDLKHSSVCQDRDSESFRTTALEFSKHPAHETFTATLPCSTGHREMSSACHTVRLKLAHSLQYQQFLFIL